MGEKLTSEVEHLIEIRNLSKEYHHGERVESAIDHMDFILEGGEFVAIMGQSGSGKSTLLSVMGGLNQPTQGEVLIDSLNIYNLSSEQRADFRNEYIGIIFQSFQLIPYLTVMENVLLPMAITGIKKKAQHDIALDVLAKVGLSGKEHRLPDQISGGEQERVAIARAIVNRPPILLADEPTGNLDSATTEEIMALLTRLNREEGLTIIMVTHDEGTCRFADRIIRLKDGHLDC